MITSVIYARLYNLGNYENERIEVTVSVEDNNLIAAHQEAVSAVQQAHDDLIETRRAFFAGPKPAVLATPKQRSYIAKLQDDLGWHSEYVAVYAREQRIDLVSMTMYEASTLIEGMKRLANPDQDIPF